MPFVQLETHIIAIVRSIKFLRLQGGEKFRGPDGMEKKLWVQHQFESQE